MRIVYLWKQNTEGIANGNAKRGDRISGIQATTPIYALVMKDTLVNGNTQNVVYLWRLVRCGLGCIACSLALVAEGRGWKGATASDGFGMKCPLLEFELP